MNERTFLNKNWRKSSAFTLIELLVVIAIIAILAGILFPVFAQAREKAKLATCESNLRQIGLAFTQYNQDFDESYPCDTSDQQLWQGQHFRWTIMPYLGFNQTRISAGNVVATNNNAEILSCPSDTSKAFNSTSYFYSFAFYVKPSDLATVTNWTGIFGPLPVGSIQPETLAKVVSPTQKILAGEWADNHDKVYSPPRGVYPPLPAGVETSRAYLFADGHVKYLQYSQINLGSDGMPDPNVTVGGIGGSDFGK